MRRLRVECDAEDKVGVAAHRLQHLARRDAPQLDRPILRTARERAERRAERGGGPQRRTSEALARYRLSAEKDESETPCVWPRSECTHFHDATFHSRIVMSAELDASQLPSGENLTQATARLCPVSVLVQT